jgi:membrane protein DedA with SNARE-associated domain
MIIRNHSSFTESNERLMETILRIIDHHGYLALVAIVFMEAIGLPVPAAVALVIGGAACAWGVMSPGWAIVVSVIGILAGDILLFFLGRKSGWWLLGFLCRVALNPETCILRSAESFYKRGRTTLLIAKFIPGVNTMAPPLAGSMRMRFSQFLHLDLGGTLLYVLAYGIPGFLFSRFLKDVLRVFENFGHALQFVIVIVLLGYIGYRVYVYWTHRVYRVVPRVQVEEIVARQKAGEEVLIADVRSHGYYDPGKLRILGSIRIEPNDLLKSVKDIPKEKLIFLYCT